MPESVWGHITTTAAHKRLVAKEQIESRMERRVCARLQIPAEEDLAILEDEFLHAPTSLTVVHCYKSSYDATNNVLLCFKICAVCGCHQQQQENPTEVVQMHNIPNGERL